MIFRVVALSMLLAGPALAADNPDMAAIFKADQTDRMATPIDWKTVRAADARRRQQTERLLDAGALTSGTDFYDAAFVFQHGETAADYLKAHLLAMAAMARGRPDAPWIAAATLDRYLQTIGKSQVLGTQFIRAGEGGFTQDPYDRTLASDAMRKALQVPKLAEQEAQRRQFEARAANKSTNRK